LVLNAKNQGFAGQVQASRLEYHRQIDQSNLGVVVKLIQQGIDDQVLQLPKGMNHTQVAFACWSTSFGTITLLLAESDQCGGRSELNIARELLNNSNLLLDGLQWQPLASLRDYKEVSEQLCQSLFLSEVEQLKKEGVLLSF
jgi:hypothetical protein